ncbi:hypothetical protein LZZ90_09820 [Flavobacterium sp. SM15]|uniref:hypothetical protein n=1 Tax=Flavobacterium sp. SM15 TaxID=2908005 RepID=UPI001ED9EE0C|nr:hypothetical protein [Flavobacterium sp. SM15]MCG2611800.1 hypothetical protein [Flavobacterium sp. SM15]
MKRIFLLAAFAVWGLVVVSCSLDDNEREIYQSKFNQVKGNDQLYSRDSIPDGPGDDPIIMPPPPPPKP